MEHHIRYGEAKRVTLIGAGVNILQGILKLVFGYLGHSHALLADGIHSFSDLLANALVLLGARYGGHDADEDHPYGHARIETVATLALALLIVLAGLGIMYDAGEHLLSGSANTRPSFYVLFIAIFSVVANEVIFRYTLRVADRIKSNLLRANAWHSRSDAAASAVVLVGVGGALLGFYYLDAIAALIVSGMIVKMGWDFGWPSLRELVDTGLDDAILADIKKSIVNVPGVRALHQLRTRSMGGKVILDVHIQVDPTLSVSEGHHVGELVHNALCEALDNISDVTVHVDPEDDELEQPTTLLPSRDQITLQLQDRWRELPQSKQIEKITLHYLGGKIYVEVHLPMESVSSLDEAKLLAPAFQSKVRDLKIIAEVKVLFY